MALQLFVKKIRLVRVVYFSQNMSKWASKDPSYKPYSTEKNVLENS